MTVKSADTKSGRRHTLELSTLEAVFFLQADTETVKDDWIGAVGRAIVKSSGTFTGESDGETDD